MKTNCIVPLDQHQYIPAYFLTADIDKEKQTPISTRRHRVPSALRMPIQQCQWRSSDFVYIFYNFY